jgi:hypothetical protein
MAPVWARRQFTAAEDAHKGASGGGVVGDAMAARLYEGRMRGGWEVMQKRYIGRASGSVGSKKEVVHKPRRRTDCKY